MSWPLAFMVIAVVAVIGVIAAMDKNVATVTNAILMLLIALGLAELREIKSNTNGSNNSLMEQNRKLMDELGQYRREAARVTDRAFESNPLTQPPTAVITSPATIVIQEPNELSTPATQTPTVQFPVTRP